jgi:hypothetical protein
MRAESAVAIALQLPLFVAAASHGHGHNHAEAHRRALTTETHVVTETVYATLTVESSSASSTTSSSASAIKLPEKVPDASPSATPPSDNNGGPYKLLVPEPENAIIVNSCAYHVYVLSVGHRSCSSGANCKLLPANGTYSEPIRACDDGGISLKVTKADDGAKPMQFEYAVWKDEKTRFSYDISYLDCMKNTNGEKDLSDCVGHDGGIQATSGPDCPTYQCVANEWCPVQAYVVAEFDYKPGAPVGSCGVEKGVAFELCAENRS